MTNVNQDVLAAIRSERILYSLTFYSFIENDFYIFIDIFISAWRLRHP